MGSGTTELGLALRLGYRDFSPLAGVLQPIGWRLPALKRLLRGVKRPRNLQPPRRRGSARSLPRSLATVTVPLDRWSRPYSPGGRGAGNGVALANKVH